MDVMVIIIIITVQRKCKQHFPVLDRSVFLSQFSLHILCFMYLSYNKAPIN